MHGWRISKARYASPPSMAFTGAGAARWGGRWNQPGSAVVYASESLALAALESFVQAAPAVQPDDLLAIQFTSPDHLQIDSVSFAELPRNWRSEQAKPILQAIGEEWLRRGDGVILSVPSVVIPQERNLLINPDHSSFPALSFEQPQSFAFDTRMWKLR